jgi:death-on-curing protein
MNGWRWICKAAALAIHDEQVAEHGGASGLRSEALLNSALARPAEIAAHDTGADHAVLAASYACGILRNRPFVGGNKRTALVVMLVFLLDNGVILTAAETEVLEIMVGAAEGTLPEDVFAAWLRRNLRLDRSD